MKSSSSSFGEMRCEYRAQAIQEARRPHIAAARRSMSNLHQCKTVSIIPLARVL